MKLFSSFNMYIRKLKRLFFKTFFRGTAKYYDNRPFITKIHHLRMELGMDDEDFLIKFDSHFIRMGKYLLTFVPYLVLLELLK